MSDTERTPRRTGLPSRSRPPEPPPDRKQALASARRAVELAADKKAADIILLEVAALTTVADYFVICSGASERQLGAVADAIVEGLKEDGARLLAREGGPGSHWLLLDFGALIVHVMAPPERDYYQLERLWAEAPTLLRVQ
ncbi:MAG TPA: ribosome silencing factor [Candidatus Limnocylindrales bacterium]|nr:ribosome silencing factor [Candidatus Limnocylindrales bacterium]